MDEKLRSYLTRSLPPTDDWVEELERIAEDENVPIMDPIGINFVMQLIRLKRPNRILEVGSAIGYSALRMLEANPNATIVTVERDEQRYNQAVQNVWKLGVQDNIQIIFGDAIEILSELKEDNKFDLVFIDAAKGQYKRFFELSSPLLSENGFILSDNVLFKGFIADPEKEHPRFQKLARKIREYNEWLIQHPDYVTTIVPIGDGVAISNKK
ncbi:O-methyltransferase [Virgibacillus salinus]|uniref:tRNA 5-hydroxyuridine methyltransferase n=1 Tax=Virgibacillus salinus TaxID=553311 RepID=A0A1H1B723_9BACI|nr:O-methyltransferase [Virgibacillus salinus]SDQ47571.1 Predicted O-methyltransferase YrrM [Virgibacillus salinus]